MPLLDHFGYRWIPHRPATEMFLKRAVIITLCLGSGAKSTAKDIKHSLSWWRISEISVFAGSLMGDIVWDKLPEKKRDELTRKVEKPAHANLITKIKFTFCRIMQKSLYKANPEYTDGKYWAAQEWLNRGRPWMKNM